MESGKIKIETLGGVVIEVQRADIQAISPVVICPPRSEVLLRNGDRHVVRGTPNGLAAEYDLIPDAPENYRQ